ncbi:MAG: FHA domain-containing protein [Chthonomonadales bacterium]
MSVHRTRTRWMRARAAMCVASLAVALCQNAKAQKQPAEATRAHPASTRTLTITVPGDGQYYLRVLPAGGTQAPAPLPIGFKGPKATVTYSLPSGEAKPRLAIDEEQTGNTAIVPPSGHFTSADTLELKRIDFDHVRFVQVKVTYDGKPVREARVTLTDADKGTHTAAVEPVSQGLATFEDVPAGKARITVQYGDGLTQTQDQEISTDHPGDRVVIPAAVSNKVPTLDAEAQPSASGNVPQAGAAAPQVPAATQPPAAPAAVPQPKPIPEQSHGGAVEFLGGLLGLAVGAAAIYLLIRWAQSGGMAATLKKIGIEVSAPQPPSSAGTPWAPNAPQPPVVADPTICPYCGQKKDAAGNCACTVGAGGPGAVPGVTPVHQPRLVGMAGTYSGAIFPIHTNGNPVTIGREPSNQVALTNDNTVSRRHASVRSERDGTVIVDEGSSNGVYVNGVRISGSHPLQPGDEVQIGSTRFRFEV